MKWISLTDLGQLNDVADTSQNKTTIIFKHSTRCSVSRMALKQFENEFSLPDDAIDAYFLDLLNHRDVSNEISLRFGIEHQSPQLLIFQNKSVVYSASHSDIDASEVANFVL